MENLSNMTIAELGAVMADAIERQRVARGNGPAITNAAGFAAEQRIIDAAREAMSAIHRAGMKRDAQRAARDIAAREEEYRTRYLR